MPDLLQETIALWNKCPATLPSFAKSFDSEEQAVREAALLEFLASLQVEVKSLPRTRSERQAAHGRVTAAFVRFARTGLELQDSHLELLLNGGFASIGTILARQARRFDSGVSTADIFQASRNAWTACGLQVLFDREMSLTPAIFAYSMLYPYTDNYLDDPATSREAKSGFNARFGKRLAGEGVAPANDREAAIWRLVEMIEGHYPRARFPQVFESLLAIQHAQENSLRLLRQGGGGREVDVLGLSFAKGGASVLADAYLAAGSLSAEEAGFAFAWGVALQLADDLQDVGEDRGAGVLTLFSQMAGRESLDALTSRTFQFSRAVAERMRGLRGAGNEALRDLIEKSSSSLLIRSAGAAGDLFTSDYLAALETHSPFRFEFLERQRQQLARRSGALTRLFEAFLEGDEDEPAFPLLPSSLMLRY